jgi:two-component system, NarL family, response regulator NreC
MTNTTQDTGRCHINILLADDHHIVRQGISSLLEKQPDICILAEANNGDEVLRLINIGKHPDIIISDINMPGTGGIELIGKVKAVAPSVKVIILSMLDNDNFVVKAFNAGASAYLLKSVSPEELLFAVRHVYTDQQYICTELAMRLVKRLANAPNIMQPGTGVEMDFTDREIEILQLIADGYTNEKIAEKLFMSKRTAEAYRKTLLEKTGTVNTAALVGFAMRNNLIN